MKTTGLKLVVFHLLIIWNTSLSLGKFHSKGLSNTKSAVVIISSLSSSEHAVIDNNIKNKINVKMINFLYYFILII